MQRPKISAVSYLNTVPLVWGFLHGPQSGSCDLDFCVPAACAAQVQSGHAALGIVPVIEVFRQGLQTVAGLGIASFGPVRSILLISRVPFDQIRTLAADRGSRTSVALARILWKLRFGADVEVTPAHPDLDQMLGAADAALIIGDAALRIDPARLNIPVVDLGQLWTETTGLPMVFAVWAGPPDQVEQLEQWGVSDLLAGSLEFGLNNINTIAAMESRTRGFPEDLVRHYLTHHIQFQIGAREHQAMERFRHHALECGALLPSELVRQ